MRYEWARARISWGLEVILDAASGAFDPLKFFGVERNPCHTTAMTIPEIAAQLRMVLGVCVKADAKVSPAQGIYFAAVQNDCSDEEIISLWLSVSSLEEHLVPIFIAKHWARRASNFIEWMALLEHNTTPPGNN